MFRDGFVVALLNPKTALFFAAFLPQFIDPSGSPMMQSVLLGALFVLVAASTDVDLRDGRVADAAGLSRRAGRRVRRSRDRRHGRAEGMPASAATSARRRSSGSASTRRWPVRGPASEGAAGGPRGSASGPHRWAPPERARTGQSGIQSGLSGRCRAARRSRRSTRFPASIRRASWWQRRRGRWPRRMTRWPPSPMSVSTPSPGRPSRGAKRRKGRTCCSSRPSSARTSSSCTCRRRATAVSALLRSTSLTKVGFGLDGDKTQIRSRLGIEPQVGAGPGHRVSRPGLPQVRRAEGGGGARLQAALRQVEADRHVQLVAP